MTTIRENLRNVTQLISRIYNQNYVKYYFTDKRGLVMESYDSETPEGTRLLEEKYGSKF